MARRSTEELTERVLDLVREYNGRISNAEAVGALEFAKAAILDSALEDDEDD